MTLSQNEATRFISVIDYRIERALGRGTVLEITYGDVDVVNDRYASVFIAGDTTASEGFRIPSGLRVESGDRVRVSIDPRGDRWIDEFIGTSGLASVGLDPERGELVFTNGFFDDIVVSRASTNVLKVDSVLHSEGGLRVTAPASSDGQNFEALRIVLPNNGYTGFAIYDTPTATKPVMKYAGYGAIVMGPGGTTDPDTSLLRAAAGTFRMTGDGTTSTRLELAGPSSGDEGGELHLEGAGAHNDWTMDNYQGQLRWFVGGTVYVQLATSVMQVTPEVHSLNEAWIAPTLTNSWQNYGGSFNTAGYRIDAMGYVHLKGLIRLGTVGSAAFTLPSGYRPLGQCLIGVNSNGAMGRVDITSGGAVTPVAPSSNAWVSLDGITFKADN